MFHCVIYSDKDRIIPGHKSSSFPYSKLIDLTPVLKPAILSHVNPLAYDLDVHYQLGTSSIVAINIINRCLKP